jgi:hypothetical protein
VVSVEEVRTVGEKKGRREESKEKKGIEKQKEKKKLGVRKGNRTRDR